MVVDELVETLCEEAEEFMIELISEERKGGILFKEKKIHINPDYWEERDITFLHEMAHYHLNCVEYIGMNRQFEEKYVENIAKNLLESSENKDYVLNYLEGRSLNFQFEEEYVENIAENLLDFSEEKDYILNYLEGRLSND